MIRHILLVAGSAAIAFLASYGFLSAQTITTTGAQIRGTVTGTHGGLGGASIEASGPVVRTTASRADGTFVLSDLASGIYTLTVHAAGYNDASRADIAITDGETVVDVTLAAANSSLRQIGSVKTTATGGHFNVTPAAVQTINAQQLDERDTPEVREILESVPGVSLSRSSEYEGNSSAAFDNVVFAVVRGGEPFETGTLIDGHPMYGAASNQGFSVGWIPTGIIQSIDIVKGPGATTPSINNAINGSVNFVTVDPRSARPGGRFEIETDGFGGSIFKSKYVGRFGDKLSFAVGYEQQESPGPSDGRPTYFILGQNNTNAINGQPFAPCVGNNCYSSPGANAAQYFGPPPIVNVQAVGCCTIDHTGYSNRGELAKLRYDFSPSLYVTAGFFGTQTFQQLGLQNLGNYVFTPPAGYTGSVPAGPIQAAMAYDGSSTAQLSGQGYNTAFTIDAVGQLGKVTLSAKAIQFNSRQNYENGVPFLGANSVLPGNVPVTLYGAAASGNAPSYTTYNGIPVQYTPSLGAYTYTYGTNLGGLTLQADLPVGDDTYTLAFDKTQYSSLFTYDYGYAFPGFTATDIAANPYPGNYEVIESLLARATFDVARNVRGVASLYYNRYDAHASVNNNVTFSDYVSTYMAPRVAFTWRPENAVSYRLSAGSSIAPAVLTNIIGGALPATPNNTANPTYYTESVTNAAVKPETAFGFDGGMDYRLRGPDIVVSTDIYTTNLVNQLFTQSTPSGTFNNLPLYVVKYQNLGRARYEGIELSVLHDARRGIFWSVAGALMRSAPYDLPASFYSLPGQPNSTNLGIINGHNFTGVNTGFNGAANGVSMPYSAGSASLGWRTRYDGFIRLDANYYGPNNQYYEPPFFVLNLSAGVPVGQRTQLTLSWSNLTNVYSSAFPIYQNGYNGGVSPVLLGGQREYWISDGPGPSVFRIGLTEKI
jgi:hypothetical protein